MESFSGRQKGWLQWMRAAALSMMPSSGAAPSESSATLTEAQTRHIATVHATARAQVRCSATLEELQKTLDCCSWVYQVINMRDSRGYNLLQRAIIVGRADIVKYMIGQGADLNSPICGRPLHLAACLGLAEVVDVLLEFSADPLVTSAVCYPEPHPSEHLLYNPTTKEWGTTCHHDVHVIKRPKSRAGATSNDLSVQVLASNDHLHNYPFYYAIKADSIPCVELLEAQGADILNHGELPLHIAAYWGAKKCMEYFIRTKPLMLTAIDGEGRSALHCCLQHGKDVVQLLVQRGTSLTCKTKHEETLLHRIFAEDVPISVMPELCCYLLDCGLKMTINAVDKDGNSALHICLLRVHQGSPQSYAGWKELETCVMLLLEHKANPNISNRDGYTPLHVLLDIFRFEERDRAIVLSEFELKVEAVERLLRLLLLHNANPSIANTMSNPSAPTNITGIIPLDTPLRMFICNLFFKGYSGWIYHAAKSIDICQRLPFLECFREMCCNVIRILGQTTGSMQQLSRSCPIKVLVRYLEYIAIYGCKMVTPEVKVAENYLEAMLAYLCTMLEAGFRPKDDHEWILILETFTVLDEHKLVPFAILHDFLLVLLQYGVETNRPEYVIYDGVPSSDMESYPIVALHAARSESRYTAEERATLIIMFINSMDKTTLRQCFVFMKKHRTIYDESNLTILTDNLYKPLKLKASCAQTIRYSLGKRLHPNVQYLPLPNEIKKYLLEMLY